MPACSAENASKRRHRIRLGLRPGISFERDAMSFSAAYFLGCETLKGEDVIRYFA